MDSSRIWIWYPLGCIKFEKFDKPQWLSNSSFKRHERCKQDTFVGSHRVHSVFKISRKLFTGKKPAFMLENSLHLVWFYEIFRFLRTDVFRTPLEECIRFLSMFLTLMWRCYNVNTTSCCQLMVVHSLQKLSDHRVFCITCADFCLLKSVLLICLANARYFYQPVGKNIFNFHSRKNLFFTHNFSFFAVYTSVKDK